MAIPNTLEDLKTYITGLEDFPVNRTTQLFYGLADTTEFPLVQIDDLVGEPQFNTGGYYQYNSTLTIHVFHTSRTNALALAREVDALISFQKITTKATMCSLERYADIREDKYKFHIVLAYKLQESA